VKGIQSILGSLHRGDLITPYLEAAVEGDLWPDQYTIEVDSSPYYGLTDLSGENIMLGSGDGYFHPSTHPLMSARELYFHFHPDHVNDKPPRKRFNFAGAMAVAAGTAMHSIIQTKLDMIDMLKEPEWEYVDDDHMVRGRIDGVFIHPEEGEYVFEYKTQSSRGFGREQEPKWGWVNQTNIGMHYKGLDRAVVLVQELGYPFSTKEFHIEKDQDLLDGIFGKFDYVRECIQRDTPPPCDHHHGSSDRTNCPFSGVCDLIEFGK
jgi:hypothetical protein